MQEYGTKNNTHQLVTPLLIVLILIPDVLQFHVLIYELTQSASR